MVSGTVTSHAKALLLALIIIYEHINVAFSPKASRTRNKQKQRKHDVNGRATIRSGICHFLLAIHWNRASISNRFRDIWPQHVNERTNKVTNPHTNELTNKCDRSQYLLVVVKIITMKWQTHLAFDKHL